MIEMGEIVIEVGGELEEEIKEFPVDWSKIALEAIKSKAFELKLERSAELRKAFVEAIASKSKLSEREADKLAVELGRKMKKGRFEKLKKTGMV